MLPPLSADIIAFCPGHCNFTGGAQLDPRSSGLSDPEKPETLYCHIAQKEDYVSLCFLMSPVSQTEVLYGCIMHRLLLPSCKQDWNSGFCVEETGLRMYKNVQAKDECSKDSGLPQT